MHEQFGENTPSPAWMSKWWDRFEQGDENIEDQSRSGRPTSVDSAAVLQALKDKPDSSLRDIKKTTGVPIVTDSRILHSHGLVPKKPRVIPHELTSEQKKQRVDTCASNLDNYNMKSLRLKLICQDEKWMHFSNPAHNPIWVGVDDPPPTRAKREIHGKKVLMSFWFSIYGVVHYEVLPDNTTVNSKIVSAELKKVKEKAPLLSRHLKIPTILWDNAKPHKSKMTQAALDRLGFNSIPHPPYSPDISPCDYHIFRSLQDHFDGTNFKTREEVEAELKSWIDSKQDEFWKRGVDTLTERWQRVVDTRGKYIVDM